MNKLVLYVPRISLLFLSLMAFALVSCSQPPTAPKVSWKLEVRGGVMNLGSIAKSLSPQILSLVRQHLATQTETATGLNPQAASDYPTHLYLSLTRNDQPPQQPVAIQITGSNFTTEVIYASGQAWSSYSLGTSSPGEYTVQFASDAQTIVGNVQIDHSNLLPQPTNLSLNTSSGGLSVTWNAVIGAQSYSIEVLDPNKVTVGKAVTKDTKTTFAKLVLAIGAPYTVLVVAYAWDITASPQQPLTTLPDKFNSSAMVSTFTLTSGNPVPVPQPSLTKLTQNLNLTAKSGSNSSGNISFNNGGSAPLTYTASLSGSAFSITSGGSGSVGAFSSAPGITVQGTCPSTSGIQSGILTLSSNDPTTPKVDIPLSLECFQGLSASLKFVRIGHTQNLDQIVGSPDGSKLATTAAGRIILWDAATGKALRGLNVGATNYPAASALAWSPDSSKLAATAGGGSLIKVFEAGTGIELLSINGLSNYSGLAWKPDGTQIATISSSSTPVQVAVYNSSTGARISLFTLSTSCCSVYPRLLGWDPGGTRILTWDGNVFNGSILVSDPSNGQTTNYAVSGSVALGGPQVADFYYDSSTPTSTYRLELRNALSGALIRRFSSSAYTSNNHFMSWSPDGNSLMVYSGAVNTVDIWNTTTDTPPQTPTLPTNSGQMSGVLGWLGNNTLSAGYNSGLIQLLNVSNGQAGLLLGYHAGPIFGLGLSSSGTRVASGSAGAYPPGYSSSSYGSLAWSDFSTDQTLVRVYENGSDFVSVRWLSGDTRVGAIVQVSNAWLLKTYDASTGSQLSSVSLPGAGSANYLDYAWSPDSAKLLYSPNISFASTNSVTVVDVTTGQLLASLTDLPAYTSSRPGWGWSSDGKQILGAYTSSSGSGTPTVGFWNPTTGALVSSLRLVPNSYYACNRFFFSSDGGKVACLTGSGVTVFSTSTGQQLGQASPNGIVQAAFDPSGKRLLILSNNRLEVFTLGGVSLVTIPLTFSTAAYPYGVVPQNLAWSGDGQYISFGDQDASLYVWGIK